MSKVTEIFGSKVFNDETMKERLPKDAYKALKKTVEEGRPLDRDLANVIAHAMKEWAIELGATHFTHWFQPMTGVTAEKHDSFIQPEEGGRVIMTFSGKELIKGEPDASSFPSGGLRATFEARGYTAWDPTSYVFIKDDTLCIPTAFCSYSGEALDKKTPLLRSMEALDKSAVRALKLFGHDEVKRVITTVGPEQEYFLIDEEMYNKRPDLIYTGRTLFGAKPPKGQELDDHYFGTIKPRVSAFMKELDEELWKLGVLAKTKHNEVAPAQHELAPVYSTTNIATDHNQLTMEMMKVVAKRHGMTCLLHEKPFAGVNGSGKHNNWSICTDTGMNLLDPGKKPGENVPFLVFLMAVIAAVDEYAPILRLSVASAGNDHRLGGNEAPPAIISIFVGDELAEVLKGVEEGSAYQGSGKVQMTMGATVLPHFTKDNTDRNRTSPFAFTGNKFEFRMPGSAVSVANANIVLNTAVAEEIARLYDKLSAYSGNELEEKIKEVLKETLSQHKRILFNGNGYTNEWVAEAEKRGLPNLKSLPDAMPYWISDESIDLFTKHGIFTTEELHSRYEILLENYSKSVHIEALTMQEMVRKDLSEGIIAYQKDLGKEILQKKSLLGDSSCSLECGILKELDEAGSKMGTALIKLSEDTRTAEGKEDAMESARFYQQTILSDMDELRKYADKAEALIPEKYLSYPTYGQMLFSLR